MADSFGQARANSGVIINNIYEIQVLDSFGLVPAMGDCGSIYDQTRPLVNASLPPEQWQTYDITFRAPRMTPDGSVTKERVTVDLNGVRIHTNVPIEGATAGHPPGKPPKNAATGPLHLQDHGNRVRYRNVWNPGAQGRPALARFKNWKRVPCHEDSSRFSTAQVTTTWAR